MRAHFVYRFVFSVSQQKYSSRYTENHEQNRENLAAKVRAALNYEFFVVSVHHISLIIDTTRIARGTPSGGGSSR
jgi:hypothetical protein